MRRRAIVLCGLIAMIVGVLATTSAIAARDKEVALESQLTGAAVVQGGDPDGSGTATVLVDSRDGVACFEVQTTNVADPITARIQSGAAGAIGPPVVILFENQVAPARGCVPADRKTVREIGKNPERYYLNVVNDEFPIGAVRGQLAPATTG